MMLEIQFYEGRNYFSLVIVEKCTQKVTVLGKYKMQHHRIFEATAPK